MKIGIPKEIKNREFRVSANPSGVREMVERGHEVLVETMAGHAIGYDDSKYEAVGAKILPDAQSVFADAEMIVKVKEPQPQECAMLREGQIVFSYLHLAPDPTLTKNMLDSGCIGIAFETVTDDRGGLPLLAPMSEVAGRVAVQAGIHCQEKSQGGRGVLLSGVTGVEPGRVTIVGGGMVGTNAATLAAGMGAEVTILERSLDRIRELNNIFRGSGLKAIYSTAEAIEEYTAKADLLIGAVLIPGAAAPKLVSREMVSNMRRGSVIVDVAIDQGGCVETIKPTTHENPIYVEEEVVHYGVTNMPAAVANSSTRALANATLPYILQIADHGVKDALEKSPHIRNGLNIYRGYVTYEAVARDLGYDYAPPESLL
jgi:alanine dehydrogenase